MRKKESGQTLFEAILVFTIMGLLVVGGTSTMDRISRRVSLRAATAELRSIFQHVRTIAVARDRNVAIKFQEQGGAWMWALYEDGDGDGVRNDDIQSKKDRQIQRPKRFEHLPAIIGVPRGITPDPLAPGKILQDRLPVRFGASTLCSFSRAGEATNGSVVITDGTNAVIVQISGAAGRIGVLRWNGTRWTAGV